MEQLQQNDNLGWVALHRSIIKSQCFKNEGLLKVWIWCLCKARHKEQWVTLNVGRTHTEVKLKVGQFIFGRHKASEELDMSGSTAWARMKKLQAVKCLDITSDNHYSVITICNWNEYQNEKNVGLTGNLTSIVTAGRQPDDSRMTAGRQPDDTYNKVNNVKNENNVKEEGDTHPQQDTENLENPVYKSSAGCFKAFMDVHCSLTGITPVGTAMTKYLSKWRPIINEAMQSTSEDHMMDVFAMIANRRPTDKIETDWWWGNVFTKYSAEIRKRQPTPIELMPEPPPKPRPEKTPKQLEYEENMRKVDAGELFIIPDRGGDKFVSKEEYDAWKAERDAIFAETMAKLKSAGVAK